MSSKTYPSLELERSLANEGHRFIIGIDEVGRGCVAGPVAVGAALIDMQMPQVANWPVGLADSKLLTPRQRNKLAPETLAWVAGSALGTSSVQEIESQGIVWSLANAAERALAELLESADLRRQLAHEGCVIILDGSHDWLSSKSGGLPVVVRPKADRDCVSVAAASIIAKVARDRLMAELHEQHSQYGWDSNVGYASEGHIRALREHGPTEHHRLSWLGKILGDLANA